MEKQKSNTNEKKNKSIQLRNIAVLIAVLIFAVIIAISIRGQYLDVIGISEDYIDVFYQNVKNKASVFGVSFITIYISVYITNKFIKKGLKKFFDDEKKEMPKLPNKSLCFIMSLIGSILVTKIITEEFLMCVNSAFFGRNDPIFGTDISFYVFKLPFYKSLVILMIEFLVVLVVYVALYYVISLNTYFDGVDVETLKKNTFIKQEMFFVILASILLAVYILLSNQGIMSQDMLTIEDKAKTELIGAGKTDVTIKLWGYRILAVVLVGSVIRLIKYVRKSDFKQSVISAAIIPVYMLCLFIIMSCSNMISAKNNEFDIEKEYIGYNIESTKEAFGISIDQKNIDNYKAITYDQVTSNSNIINNIPVISEDVTLKSVAEHQENSVYYSYDNTTLGRYKINDVNKLVYITPREVLNDSTISYNSRTYKYTHGYSTVVSTATDSDKNGYAEYVLSDFNESDKFRITEPRIYFGLKTDSAIIVNTDFGKEYDYPITATNYNENVYNGKAGLKLNFMDKLVVAIREKNIKLAFSSYTNEDSKIITNRNIIERAKVLLPNVLYDEDPYLVVTNEGRLVWVLDGYTRTHNYPYSQKCEININGYKERLNYIRNSVKILVDAYDGTMKFYITDRDDPIIMAYQNIYPTLFVDSNEQIPEDIQEHLVYPKFLYKIQASMINMYHEVSEDVLYRADDIWQITPNTALTNSSSIEPYYTILKTKDDEKEKFGLVVTFNKQGKQNIISYLVGSVENGKSKLSLYKFNSENNVIGIAELNNQIEQDTTISAELEALNAIGTKLVKDMLIIPINNTLLYVEPVYQVRLNEKEGQIPILKKVIVASGNTVAIGDTIDEAVTNLFTDYAVDLEFIDTEDITSLVDSAIKANKNLAESIDSADFEMIGKDISKLQAIIKQLETAREKEIEKEKQEKEEAGIGLPSIFGNENETENIVENKIENSILSNDVNNKINNTIN